MKVSFKSTPAYNMNEQKIQKRNTAAAVAGTALGIAALATAGKAAGKSEAASKFFGHLKEIAEPVTKKIKHAFTAIKVGEKLQVVKDFVKGIYNKVADKVKDLFDKPGNPNGGVSAKAKEVFHKVTDKENGVVAKAKDMLHKAADKENGVAAKAKGLFHKAADKETGIIPRAKELLANLKERFAVPEKFHPEHFQVDQKLGEQMTDAAKRAAEKL